VATLAAVDAVTMGAVMGVVMGVGRNGLSYGLEKGTAGGI
jgi:hypothetical protein